MTRWLPFLKTKPTVAVVRLSGVIASTSRGALNDASLRPIFEKAFQKGKPAAVALEINSPGGSPVQSSLIGATIRRLSEEKNVPVYAFVEDVAASGGYWLATAADEIWADPSSVVGSIGVISSGFGAHEFLVRQGFERRVYTAGKSKSMLDPFRPATKQDVARLRVILDDLHQNFIEHVKQRRGESLTTETDVFTGEIWLAERARELGLIDGIGHLQPKMVELFGDKVTFKCYSSRGPIWRRLGSRVVDDMLFGIEERAAFAHYGL
ncbi:MAG: S49 family peptidase [Aestuariivita sp.]|nr:S49 family peptidase [Aestuariivita sp.]MCY4347298.1 S49 family peptidase [Aestuariivita sp.]